MYFGTGSDCLYITDPDTGERRRGRIADVEGLSALCEALPHIDFVMSMVSPEDVRPEEEAIRQHAAMLRGTRKPLLVVPRDGYQLARMKEMAEACGGGDSLIVYAMPSPPLMHDEFALTKVIECARLEHPARLRAGALRRHERAGLDDRRRRRRQRRGPQRPRAAPGGEAGAAFVYGTGSDTLDMRTMINPYVSPEWALGGQAGCDLAHFYGLPSFSYAGFSDSKCLDEQWAAETALTTVDRSAVAQHAAPRRRLPRVGAADLLRGHRPRRRAGRVRQAPPA